MIEFERPKPLSNSLSITPLVDIIFLLLLFFLLTSVFITPGIPLDLPEAATAEFQEQPTQEVVYISRLGEIYWNDRFMSIDDLSQALSQALQQRTDRQVTIKADKEVAFGLFVRVMDLVKAAGGEDLVISAEFPE
ncbi:MAG: biopolymer transporter ExbD [Candidatus Vecturithrix sp.]|jgi:biopolymer transport protein ExbD|nr:biopolymer transporter ExbD [Candidatus Vecturithrix sp.]